MNYDQHLERFRPVITAEDETSKDWFDYRALIAPLWRHRLVLVCSFVLAFALAWLVTGYLTPVYRGTATLQLQEKQANLLTRVEETFGLTYSATNLYLNTQLQLLESDNLFEDIVDELNLVEHPALTYPSTSGRLISWLGWKRNTSPSEQRLRKRTVARIRGSIRIQPVPKSFLVYIHFESTDPQLASDVPNALGNAFIRDYLSSQLKFTSQASNWIGERLGNMDEELELSLRSLQDYRESEGLVDVQGVRTLTEKEIDQLSNRLITAREKTLAAKAQLAAVGESILYNSDWEVLPTVLRDSFSSSMKSRQSSAQAVFAKVKQKYGPKHPVYQESQSLLAEASRAYGDRVQSVVSSFEEIYKQAIDDEKAFESSLEAAKSKLIDISRKEYELARLTQNYETSKTLYELFFTRLREANTTDFETANARFRRYAELPLSPFKPRRQIISLIVGLVVLSSVALLLVMRELTDTRAFVGGDLETKVGLSVLGVVDLFDVGVDRSWVTGIVKSVQGFLRISSGHADDVDFLRYGGGDHRFNESVRSLRTNVILEVVDSQKKVLLVTSSVTDEGKSTISAGLAMGLGEVGKTLLIDGDMRRPSLDRTTNTDRNKIVGLNELLLGRVTLDDCVVRREDLKIDVLPAGVLKDDDPSKLLSSGAIKKIVDEARDKYDWIVIDSPPIQPVSDAIVLSQLVADGVVFVVRSASTNLAVIKDSVEMLNRANTPILGGVLNMFDPSRAKLYAYYTGRYDYYLGRSYTHAYDKYAYAYESSSPSSRKQVAERKG